MYKLKATFAHLLLVGFFVILKPVVAAGQTYDELVDLFFEFREFQQATITEGVPDYTEAAMEDQYRGLQEFQSNLAGIDTADWPVWQQVDYHLVRAEMNALEFHHKEHRPWARDPGFYSMFEGDAGASINAPDFFRSIYDLFGFSDNGPEPSDEEDDGAFSLSGDQQAALQSTLAGIPQIYVQARENLTEPAADFAEFAVRNFVEERELYEEAAGMLADGYPDLADEARRAAASVEDYRQWLQSKQSDMAPNAGLGKDNYDWWMRNVQLSPWGWEESNQIVEREYDRIITFLKLEENRNKHLPPLEVAMSEQAWFDSMREALHHVVDYMRDEELMTVDDWVDPSDYYADGPRGASGELDDSPSERLLPENSSIDTKVRQREILPGETHEYIGHMLDYQRQARLTQSPIRSAGKALQHGLDAPRRLGGSARGIAHAGRCAGRETTQGPGDGVPDERLAHEPCGPGHEDARQRDRPDRSQAPVRGDHAAGMDTAGRAHGLVRNAVEPAQPGRISQQCRHGQGLFHEAVQGAGAGVGGTTSSSGTLSTSSCRRARFRCR